MSDWRYYVLTDVGVRFYLEGASCSQRTAEVCRGPGGWHHDWLPQSRLAPDAETCRQCHLRRERIPS